MGLISPGEQFQDECRPNVEFGDTNKVEAIPLDVEEMDTIITLLAGKGGNEGVWLKRCVGSLQWWGEGKSLLSPSRSLSACRRRQEDL